MKFIGILTLFFAVIACEESLPYIPCFIDTIVSTFFDSVFGIFFGIFSIFLDYNIEDTDTDLVSTADAVLSGVLEADLFQSDDEFDSSESTGELEDFSSQSDDEFNSSSSTDESNSSSSTDSVESLEQQLEGSSDLSESDEGNQQSSEESAPESLILKYITHVSSIL